MNSTFRFDIFGFMLSNLPAKLSTTVYALNTINNNTEIEAISIRLNQLIVNKRMNE